MTSYNKLNGVSCSHNERLLKDILREEWGYEGLVMSDWYVLGKHTFKQVLLFDVL
jgi:beta-glucosidase